MGSSSVREEARLARIAAITCRWCGVGLDEGLKLYSVGDGSHECENHLDEEGEPS